MNQANTRLRRTFRYPTDNDNDQFDLDEEEQEVLIDSLKAQNTSTNEQYKLYFLALPILSIIPYVSLLFTPQTLPALLSITSLACTTYLLHFLPPSKTGFSIIDTQNAGAKHQNTQQGGPLVRYLPYLNLFLGGILLLSPLVGGNGNKKLVDPQYSQLFNVLPLGVYLFTLVAKMVMGSVDVDELDQLKYDYKGA